jgi:hypothetical protein
MRDTSSRQHGGHSLHGRLDAHEVGLVVADNQILLK